MSLGRAKRLQKDYREAKLHGRSNGFDIAMMGDNIDLYYILLNPMYGPFKGGKYILEMNTAKDISHQFPISAPSIKFLNPPFHPNINELSGAICVDILTNTKQWSTLNNFTAIINNIYLLFCEPNPNSAYNGDAAFLWKKLEKIKEDKIAMLRSQNLPKEIYGKKCVELEDEMYSTYLATARSKERKSIDISKFAEYFPQLTDESYRVDEKQLESSLNQIDFTKLKQNVINSTENAMSEEKKRIEEKKEKEVKREALKTKVLMELSDDSDDSFSPSDKTNFMINKISDDDTNNNEKKSKIPPPKPSSQPMTNNLDKQSNNTIVSSMTIKSETKNSVIPEDDSSEDESSESSNSESDDDSESDVDEINVEAKSVETKSVDVKVEAKSPEAKSPEAQVEAKSPEVKVDTNSTEVKSPEVKAPMDNIITKKDSLVIKCKDENDEKDDENDENDEKDEEDNSSSESESEDSEDSKLTEEIAAELDAEIEAQISDGELNEDEVNTEEEIDDEVDDEDDEDEESDESGDESGDDKSPEDTPVQSDDDS